MRSMLSFPFGRVVLSRSRRGAFRLRVAVPIVVHCFGATVCRAGVLSLWFLSFVSPLLCFFVVRLLHSKFLLQLIACKRSTSPPGGNQVGGLPPALRRCFWARRMFNLEFIEICKFVLSRNIFRKFPRSMLAIRAAKSQTEFATKDEVRITLTS